MATQALALRELVHKCSQQYEPLRGREMTGELQVGGYLCSAVSRRGTKTHGIFSIQTERQEEIDILWRG